MALENILSPNEASFKKIENLRNSLLGRMQKGNDFLVRDYFPIDWESVKETSKKAIEKAKDWSKKKVKETYEIYQNSTTMEKLNPRLEYPMQGKDWLNWMKVLKLALSKKENADILKRVNQATRQFAQQEGREVSVGEAYDIFIPEYLEDQMQKRQAILTKRYNNGKINQAQYFAEMNAVNNAFLESKKAYGYP